MQGWTEVTTRTLVSSCIDIALYSDHHYHRRKIDHHRCLFTHDLRPPFILKCIEQVSHWHKNLHNPREKLILSPGKMRSNETVLSEHRSLSGIDHRSTYGGR